MDKKKRMAELIALLEKENHAYYEQNESLVPDHEWDKQLDELEHLEKETGIILANSPLHKVSGGVVDSLKKVRHTKPMLSCDKTKDRTMIFKFCDGRKVIVSFKMDGLTIVARYKNGKLVQLITRGDGEVGEDITHNASAIANLPLEIPCLEEFEVRGEGVISWADFNKYNEGFSEEEEASHPRNLASGSVRQLDCRETKKRHVVFCAFELVKPYHPDREEQYQLLADMGFMVVKHTVLEDYDMAELERVIDEDFNPVGYEFPVDGVVFDYKDVDYGKSLGATGHHENCRMALKWPDRLYSTKFLGVVLNTTRTGRVSLTAAFQPVMIDGAKVQRATLHNLAFFRNLKLGVGDEIKVYKANMIIPAIAENVTKSNTYQLDMTCPKCGHPLVEDGDDLRCLNPHCPAQWLQQLIHFVSKPCMNIDGLAASGLQRLVEMGLVTSYGDLFRLAQHRQAIVSMDGWGEGSFRKLMQGIESARHTSLQRLIPAFGIPMVGKTAGKTIHKHFHGDVTAFMKAVTGGYDFHQLPDFGDIMCKNLTDFFADEKNLAAWSDVLKEVTWEADPEEMTAVRENPFMGKTVVATGTFANFSRTGINEKLESLGAKAGSSVSKKTDYVIAGEKAGSKLDKAKALGVPVLSEDEFLQMIG